MSALTVRDITVSYGGLRALDALSFSLEPGEIFGVAGPNGAGKTTLLRAIAGLIHLQKGTISFQGEVVSDAASRVRPTARSNIARGICLVPEGRALFPGLSVEEHLRLGGYVVGSSYVAQDIERVYRIFPKLEQRRRQDVSTLSGGERQMVAISRGLMSRPKLLMIDELSLGLAPVIVNELLRALAELNAAIGISLLLVDESLSRLGASVSKILFIARGGLQAVLSPEEAAKDAASLYLAAD